LEIRSLKYEIDELKRETAELRKETRSFRLSPTHTSRMVSSINSFEFFCSHYTLSLKAGIHHSMQQDLPSGELKQDCYTGVGHIAQTFVTNLCHGVGFSVGITETLDKEFVATFLIKSLSNHLNHSASVFSCIFGT